MRPPATREDLGSRFAGVRGSLLGYLRRRVGDPVVAEDLLQDVFVKALVAIDAGRAPTRLQAWLYAAARTTAIDYYRTARRGRPEPLPEDLADTPPDEEARMRRELAACLRPFTEELPPIYRDTLIATDLEGRKMRRLAEEEGVSVSAIKSRASRARAMLREKLIECCRIEISGGVITDYLRRTPVPSKTAVPVSCPACRPSRK
jgi:RNA polymerase sigma-70 factor (ECF subfamily)